MDKLCTLSFVEIHLSDNIEIDEKLQKVYGPVKTYQVAIVQGLFSQWKQPIYFKYDQQLVTTIGAEIVENTISELYDVGFTVVTFNTDMCSANTTIWKKWKVGCGDDEKTYFMHPRNKNLKVYVFADAPHLLKLMRNHYFDSGFRVSKTNKNEACFSGSEGGCTQEHKHGYHLTKFHLKKNVIEELLKLEKSDLKIAFRVKQEFLEVKGS